MSSSTYSFLYDHGVAILFGFIGLVTSTLAVHYARAQLRSGSTATNSPSKYLKLYTSRESMVLGLAEMYEKASGGDVIWGQCVSCSGYSASVKQNVLDASIRGVSFEIIINSRSPRKQELFAIYSSIKSANVIERADNEVSLQGLSEKEVILSLPEVAGYCAVKISQPTIVLILRSWFITRLDG